MGRVWSRRSGASPLALRAALFPFAENKHGDAPMRALIAERMVLDPAQRRRTRGPTASSGRCTPRSCARSSRSIATRRRSSRYLSFLAGMAVFLPFWRLRAAWRARSGAELAALALAVSPLHLQASTTAASEALYLLLWVACLERLLAALDFERSAEPAEAALRDLCPGRRCSRRWRRSRATTPGWRCRIVAGGLAFVARPSGRARRCAAAGAVFGAWRRSCPRPGCVWGGVAGGDPLFFAHYISADHAQPGGHAPPLATAPLLGRVRQLGIWTLAFAAAMTPAGLLFAGAGAARRWRDALAAPPALRRARRGARAPGSLPGAGAAAAELRAARPLRAGPGRAAAAARGGGACRRTRAGPACAAVPLARGLSPADLAWSPRSGAATRIWGGAESMGALTRLDDEDRALAAHLRAHRPPGERVMIEPLAFADIAHRRRGGRPLAESITLIVTREPGPSVADDARDRGALDRRLRPRRAAGRDACPTGRATPDSAAGG